MAVPTAKDVQRVVELDKIFVNCYVTDDLTIKVVAKSSSLGEEKNIELQDLIYGLETN